MPGRPVHKAVMPVAGYGTRFLPATKAQPKEMITVVDRPAIQYMVEEAVRAGVDDVLLVTSAGKSSIDDHFDRNIELEHALRDKGKDEELEDILRLADLATVHSVRQGEQLGLGHAVLQAREHVGDESFAVLLGDDIIDPIEPFLERMLEVHERTGRSVVAVMPVAEDEVSAYGVVTTRPTDDDDTHLVTDLVEKPSRDEAPSNLAIIGRYVLTPDVFDVLERTEPGRGGEIQLTDALRTMAKDEPIVAVEFRGERHDVGNKLGFLKATVMIAADRPDLGEEFLRWLTVFVEERKAT